MRERERERERTKMNEWKEREHNDLQDVIKTKWLYIQNNNINNK